MVTLQNADKVLKSVYLDALTEQLNNKTSPFYTAIEKDNQYVSGKDVKFVVRYGINGGVCSGSEIGDLPVSAGNNYESCTAPLKNLYGTIELSDKVIRASEKGDGSVVSVLGDEMNGLLEAAKFNFARMLWQTGSGTLTQVSAAAEGGVSTLSVYDTRNLAVGMVVDIGGDNLKVRIAAINTNAKTVTFSSPLSGDIAAGTHIRLQQSYNAEINGIPYIFGDGSDYYGRSTSEATPLLGHTYSINSTDFSTELIQKVIDETEARGGVAPNMLICSYEVRRRYLALLKADSTNVDYLNLDGGFTALSYNGIPVVADRFCPKGEMYFLNTADFRLAQLCDWQWLEGETGNILKQLDRKPAYMATLVKYANLICLKGFAQSRIAGIV